MHVLPDDISVIQRVLLGEQSAYAILVDRYQSYVFTLIMRYVNNREVAEELAQDVFVKAYRCLSDFRGNSKFSTWLYTIVHTTCLSHKRKKDSNMVLVDEETMLTLPGVYSTDNTAHMTEQRLTKKLLANALQQLPEDDARIITLHYLAEQSVEETGIIMGLTVSNVKVRLMRARHKLKDVLDTRYKKALNSR